jgi:hypothetical protein
MHPNRAFGEQYGVRRSQGSGGWWYRIFMFADAGALKLKIFGFGDIGLWLRYHTCILTYRIQQVSSRMIAACIRQR